MPKKKKPRTVTHKRDSIPDLVPAHRKERHLTHGPMNDRITTFYQPNGVHHINHYHARNYYTISDMLGEYPTKYRSRTAAKAALLKLGR